MRPRWRRSGTAARWAGLAGGRGRAKWAGLRGHAPIPPAEAARRGAKMAAESGPDPELEELLESERGSGGGGAVGPGVLGVSGGCGALWGFGVLGDIGGMGALWGLELLSVWGAVGL